MPRPALSFGLLALAAAVPAEAGDLAYDLTDLVPAQAETPDAADAAARDAVEPEQSQSHGPKLHYALLDRLEWAPKGDSYSWDFSALAGGGTDRVYFGSSGDGAFAGRLEYLELDLFYSRNVGGDWDLNAGLRYDNCPTRAASTRRWVRNMTTASSGSAAGPICRTAAS